MARIENAQTGRVVEITQLHYHVLTPDGKYYWIAKVHSAAAATVDDSVRIILKKQNWVRRWWIESKN